MSYQKSINRLKEIISYDKLREGLLTLPDDVDISTMTVCFNFNNDFNIENITKWLKLNPDTVIAVGKRTLSDQKKKKPKKDATKMTDLLKEKTKQECQQGKKRGRKPKNKAVSAKQQKNKKCFFNQVSLKILVPGKKKNKPVNVKLFNNGAVQMTGCVTLQDSLDAIYNTTIALNNIRAIIVKGKIKEVPFCSKTIKVQDITEYKIGMINSGFKLPFWTDRNNLLNLMLSDNIDALYDRNVHASVIVKHSVENNDVTILIFEKGPVIITGAKNHSQINETYNYINNYLLKNYMKISKRAELSDNHILKYLNN